MPDDRTERVPAPAERRSRPAAPIRQEAVERLSAAAERAGLRVGVSVRSVVGLLLIVLLVGCVLGFRVLRAEQRAAPRPIAPASGLTTANAGADGPVAPAATATGQRAGTVTGSGAPSGVAAGTGPPTAVAASVVVHVVGQVRRPGVVRLAAGARVQQAVAAAGGALPSAELAGVNLARAVVDGEQVVVPRPGEAASPAAGPLVSSSAGAGGSGGSSGAQTHPGRIVDLNTAQLSDLDTLPGVGPVLAQRIVDWRTANGRFTSVDELGEVSGIGDTVLSRLRPLVRV